MRVLLADPPTKGTNIDASYSNLGLLYLAGSVKAKFDQGEVDLVYLGPKHDLKSHLEFVADFAPDVYGISFASKSASLSYRTIDAVRVSKLLAPRRSAAAGLGLLPDQTVAFEDSPNGILAAKRAGLFCIAVPNPVTRPLDFSGADFILESFCQMPLDKTLANLNCVGNKQEGSYAR